MIVKIESEKCTGCALCIEDCPMAAIELKDGKAVVIAEMCRGCEACVMSCPQEAIVEDPKFAPAPQRAPQTMHGWRH
ncbi:MAG: 4Fe-4S binding protein [Deltaproteobacteria bacterium]|nr:4Fe-4S binding protein [Deltaproteobacteria bacterium]